MAEVLKGKALEEQLGRIPEWEAVEEHHLRRRFEFRDFKGALAFVNLVGELAEEQNHHPEITFTWGKATVEVFSHDAGGITEKDLALAERVDRI